MAAFEIGHDERRDPKPLPGQGIEQDIQDIGVLGLVPGNHRLGRVGAAGTAIGQP